MKQNCREKASSDLFIYYFLLFQGSNKAELRNFHFLPAANNDSTHSILRKISLPPQIAKIIIILLCTAATTTTPTPQLGSSSSNNNSSTL